MENLPQNRKHSRLSAGILVVGMLLALGLRAHGSRENPEVLEAPRSAAEWVAWAGAAERDGRLDAVPGAYRAALTAEPWHPGAVRGFSLFLLARDESEPLRDWMEELLLGDARLAEQIFDLPEFRTLRSQEPFQALHREAVIQARD